MFAYHILLDVMPKLFPFDYLKLENTHKKTVNIILKDKLEESSGILKVFFVSVNLNFEALLCRRCS